MVGAGEVDVLLAFEKAEALRNLDQLRRAPGDGQYAGHPADHGDSQAVSRIPKTTGCGRRWHR